MIVTYTSAQIDAAAKYLRNTTQGTKRCQRLTPWEDTPKATKKKWLRLAAGVLDAALREEQQS